MLQINPNSKRFVEGFCLNLVSVLVLLIPGQPALAIPNGEYLRPELLIQPEDLKALIDRKDSNIRIIDVREKVKYLAGHVPGAVHVWRLDIVDKNHPTPGMMAPKEQIEELMGKLGISDKHTLVIYSDGPDGARILWVLAYYGFPIQQMKLLDGGLDGWKAKGYSTEMIPSQISQASFKLQGKTRPTEHLLCTLPEVRDALKNPKTIVLDVRAPKEYTGEEMLRDAVRPGRIPGVVWIEWSRSEEPIETGPPKK